MFTRLLLVFTFVVFALPPAAAADSITGLDLSASASRISIGQRIGHAATIFGLADGGPPICIRPHHPHFPVFLDDDDDEPAFWVDDDDIPFDDDVLPLSDGLPGIGNSAPPLAAVPEPATLALFGTGLIAVAVRVRRRLQRQS